jgi:hypothetical protein
VSNFIPTIDTGGQKKALLLSTTPRTKFLPPDDRANILFSYQQNTENKS